MADAKTLFVLLECAAGYALFEVVAFEEIGSLLEGSMDTVTDLQRFGRAVKLKAFQPFESAQDALENANAISEHAMTGSLHNFLEMNLPKVKKSSKTASFSLGVIDPALATAISDGLSGISCRSDDTVKEILRGCRLHLDSFVKGLEGGAAEKAQLGLGHSYSRSKVKFNPARSDNMIIQSIALLDQMDKDLNTFAMRVREWYSYTFPELKDIVKDNYMFARCAAFIQDKGTLFKEGEDAESKLEGLKEIVGDEEMVKAIVTAARTSMGMDCSAVDMVNIINFTQRMVKLAEYRKQLALYLTEKMAVVAPNLSALLGDTVAARLISKVRCVLSIRFCTHAAPLDSPLISTLCFMSTGWLAYKSGKGSSLNSTDSWSRKGSLPCSQDKGQHPQVRPHLPFHLYWPCRRQEQGSYFTVSGQQVLYCDAYRFLLG